MKYSQCTIQRRLIANLRTLTYFNKLTIEDSVRKELEYSNNELEKLTIFNNKLGFEYITSKISPDTTLFTSSSLGAGYRSLVNDPLHVEKVLRDVLSCGPGYVGPYFTHIMNGVLFGTRWTIALYRTHLFFAPT